MKLTKQIIARKLDAANPAFNFSGRGITNFKYYGREQLLGIARLFNVDLTLTRQDKLSVIYSYIHKSIILRDGCEYTYIANESRKVFIRGNLQMLRRSERLYEEAEKLALTIGVDCMQISNTVENLI